MEMSKTSLNATLRVQTFWTFAPRIECACTSRNAYRCFARAAEAARGTPTVRGPIGDFSDFEAREHGHMTRTEQYRLTSGLGLICTRGDTPAGRSPMSGRIRRQADYRVPAGRTDHKGGLW